MTDLFHLARNYTVDLIRSFFTGWNQFWFTPSDPTTLASVRIITGVVLLYVHLTALTDLQEFIGPDAWVDEAAMHEFLQMPFLVGPEPPGSLEQQPKAGDGMFSIWYWVQDPAQIWTIHGLFIVAFGCMTLGLFSRTACIVSWIAHLSYIQRGMIIFYGMDSILALLTLYLMFGPTGATLSLDRLLFRKKSEGTVDPFHARPSVAANIVIRLIQVHICIVYLAAGLAKLQGATWWNGSAIYYTIMVPEFALFDMGFVAQADWLWLAVSHIGVLFTLWTEIGFTFMIWHPKLRPLMLACAIMLQIGIGVFMGLGSFQAAMFAGMIAFIPPESMKRFLGHFVKS